MEPKKQILKRKQQPSKGPPVIKNGPVFRPYFRHYLTGKVYFAEDYGHRGWPIGR